eukprot:gene29488-4251_t
MLFFVFLLRICTSSTLVYGQGAGDGVVPADGSDHGFTETLTAADEADGDANMPDDRHDLDVGLK